MNGELNKHYSESKEKEIDILDMDLIHLVRSYSKSIGQGITDKELSKHVCIPVANMYFSKPAGTHTDQT